MKERVAALRKLLANTEVKVVAGGDHMTTLIKPEFGASIIAFLRANKLRPARKTACLHAR